MEVTAAPGKAVRRGIGWNLSRVIFEDITAHISVNRPYISEYISGGTAVISNLQWTTIHWEKSKAARSNCNIYLEIDAIE